MVAIVQKFLLLPSIHKIKEFHLQAKKKAE